MESLEIEDDYSPNPEYATYVKGIKDSFIISPLQVRCDGEDVRMNDMAKVLPNKLVKITFDLAYDMRSGLSTTVHSITVLRY